MSDQVSWLVMLSAFSPIGGINYSGGVEDGGHYSFARLSGPFPGHCCDQLSTRPTLRSGTQSALTAVKVAPVAPNPKHTIGTYRKFYSELRSHAHDLDKIAFLCQSSKLKQSRAKRKVIISISVSLYLYCSCIMCLHTSHIIHHTLCP